MCLKCAAVLYNRYKAWAQALPVHNPPRSSYPAEVSIGFLSSSLITSPTGRYDIGFICTAALGIRNQMIGREGVWVIGLLAWWRHFGLTPEALTSLFFEG
jgi:hypothetical protein